ncbi:MAG: catabolite gene activator protein [Methylibium sp. NZG]|nr:MAG: catabolite gene activator protein [Methylibium sp. NZG]
MIEMPDLDLLRRVPLFALLDEAQLRILAGGTTRTRVPRGGHIVEHQRRANMLFILLSGEARVYIADARRREVTLATLRPGDHVGEMSLIDDEPHSATVTAETACELLALGREQFAACLPQSNSLAFAILLGLVRRLRHADEHITSLALLDVYGRVARALLEMAEEVGGQLLIRQKVSREALSKVVGASREMTGRVLRSLERRGAILIREDGSVALDSSLPGTAVNGRRSTAQA